MNPSHLRRGAWGRQGVRPERSEFSPHSGGWKRATFTFKKVGLQNAKGNCQNNSHKVGSSQTITLHKRSEAPLHACTPRMPLGQEAGAGEGFGAVPPDMGSQSLCYNLYPSTLKEISPECSREGLMLKLKLQSFGHLMRRPDSLEKTLMLGKIEGRRRRG